MSERWKTSALGLLSRPRKSNRQIESESMNKKRKWKVTQGSSTAVVVASDYWGAKERACQLGFHFPDSIVLVDG